MLSASCASLLDEFPPPILGVSVRHGEAALTRFQIQPASCFAILQYKSIASESCCFSMYSPSVCAT